MLSEASVVVQAHTRLGSNLACPLRVGWLQREFEPMPHFVFYDEQANFIGRAKHVMLAPGPWAAFISARAGPGAQRPGHR